LIELLVVIAIIGILASIIITNVQRARINSNAAKMVSDFRSIETAFEFMSTDLAHKYPHEDLYGDTNVGAPCHDEPVLSATDLFSNITGNSKWSGPYMQGVPSDPFGREYSYDNDADTWDATTNPWGGVNIQLQWCSGEGGAYMVLAPLIDDMYDAGDGGDAGKFRWDDIDDGAFGVRITAGE